MNQAIRIEVDGKTRIIQARMIDYHTENDLECRYKGYHISIARQDTDDFNTTVTAEDGGDIVDGFFGGPWCKYNIKTMEDCLRMCIKNILL